MNSPYADPTLCASLVPFVRTDSELAVALANAGRESEAVGIWHRIAMGSSWPILQ